MNFKYIFVFLSFILLASNRTAATDLNKTEENSSGSSLVALPYAYYSPETKIAIGVGSIYSFRLDKKATRPSNTKIAFTYTQRKQIIISFIPEIYFNDENYLFNGFYTFYKYPDKFWGIGGQTPGAAEEDYEPKYLRTFTNFQKRILPGLYLGIRQQYEYIKLIETDADGILQHQKIPGSAPSHAVGLGLLATYDTRNNIYFPTSGHYYQLYAMAFNKSLGSDHEFTLYTVDLRAFYGLFGKHVLAFQTLNIFISGTPPFQMLGLLGGSYWMRGYYFGRYRDKKMLTFQMEYRIPLFWRIGMVGFAGAGDVAPQINDFKINNLKPTFGLGIRFMFDTKEKINARLDFGIGRDGNSGVYAMVVEAF